MPLMWCHTRTLVVQCYFVLKLVISCSLYHYACPQTCALKVQLQDSNHLKKCYIFLILLNLPLEIEDREDLTWENWRSKKSFKVCDRDQRRKCIVRVGFLAVLAAVKLQDPRILRGLRSLDPTRVLPRISWGA